MGRTELHSCPQPIKPAKKDLMELLDFVPPVYHAFYRDLLSGGTEDSEDESEDDSESDNSEQSDPEDSDWLGHNALNEVHYPCFTICC